MSADWGVVWCISCCSSEVICHEALQFFMLVWNQTYFKGQDHPDRQIGAFTVGLSFKKRRAPVLPGSGWL